MKKKAVVNKNNSMLEKKEAPSIYEIFHVIKEINSNIKRVMAFIQEENQIDTKELDNLNNVNMPNKDIETNKHEESKNNKNLNIDSDIELNEDNKKISKYNIINDSKDIKIMNKDSNIEKNEDKEVNTKISSFNIINDSKEIKNINKDLNNDKNEESKVIKKIKCSNLNNEFKERVKTNNNIKKDEVNIVSITGDGNCFYRSISFFLLGSEEYYMNIKSLIIQWIENNFSKFEEFFSDDDDNNINYKEKASQEFEAMKKDYAWGSFYSFEIACIIFNLSIGVYTTTAEEDFKKYFLFENKDKTSELMLINYINNNHFNLLYSKNYNIENICLFENLKDIKSKKNYKIKYIGEKLKYEYVECAFYNSKNIYNEIYNYLQSINLNKNLIEKKIKKYPKMSYNQALSFFDIKYPERMDKKIKNYIKLRQRFRKIAAKFILDENQRLCIKNPLNKKEEIDIVYKIPLKIEIDNLINNIHINNNHSGVKQTVNKLYAEKWYWHGINEYVTSFIKLCPKCCNPGKYKKFKRINKIIMDNGPHYRYIGDLWELPKKIYNKSGYRYIIDIVDHFSKWYYGYLLKTKSAEEVLLKIDTFIQSFGEPKIFQCDNGTEFSNRLLKNYCIDNNINLVFSSPYHPQTNGACESVHKEIRKYLLNKFINNENNFDIEKELLNVIKIHNNKVHSSTSRIPKEIKDLQDQNEIEIIKAIIYDNLSLKNKDNEYIDISNFFVIDGESTKVNKNRIVKKENNKKKKKKIICKIPIRIINEFDNVKGDYIIEIMKNVSIFKIGDTYIISKDLLEQVNEKLCLNILNE